jgi:hypothetical protein
VTYVVNGQVYELLAPPLEIVIAIIQEIKALAGLQSSSETSHTSWPALVDRIISRSAGPSYGGFRLGAGGHLSEVTVMAQPSPRGDRVLLQISVIDPVVTGIAESNLRQLFANRGNPARAAAPEGPIPA